MLKQHNIECPNGLRESINKVYRADELTLMTQLCDVASLTPEQLRITKKQATVLVKWVRSQRKKSSGIDSFLSEYSLQSDEGIALMCLAEALLRVPDKATRDQLIKDKLAFVNWKSHFGQSHSFFVNATTWGLMLTGKVLNPKSAETRLSRVLMKFINRSTEAFIRGSVTKAMRVMSKQFIMGLSMDEARARAKDREALGYLYSYDMLGESAITEADSARYYIAYQQAIESIGQHVSPDTSVYQRPGISIKLSALHPRYSEVQYSRVMEELVPKLLKLAFLAKTYDIPMTIDAEESERLDLSLDVMEAVFLNDSLDGWNGFGFAIQSYQKRAFYVLDWAADLARKKNRRMMVRLIKGAYWDSEIKKTQTQGLTGYPVFTRKSFTDVSFQACAKKLLKMTDVLYPMFATHNAYSVAMILTLAGDYRDFEFQCLHGMGTELYERIVPQKYHGIACRIYAPVGSYEDLLPYLVRRLLENGANSSFVHRIVDDDAPIAELVADPVKKAIPFFSKINQNIPLPEDLFLPIRINSTGIDFTNRYDMAILQEERSSLASKQWSAHPLVVGRTKSASMYAITSPAAFQNRVGTVQPATADDIDAALTHAKAYTSVWSSFPVTDRAILLQRFADLLQSNSSELMALACLEAGKTWNDAIGEVREAIDFCRYYASMAVTLMSHPTKLKGYTGECNELNLYPRGIVLCISPWNFPLAIFVGQVVAGLATGNCVIAKPAEQTPLIASLAVKLMHQAGIPLNAVQLLPGSGEEIGAALVNDERINAVLFTGSTQTAHHINQILAARAGEIVPFIAETGGQNAMIVDSSALLEQLIVDVMNSAFGSAGQRCSALRVLFIQEDIYERTLALLKGAMALLNVGDPRRLCTDIGPVIDDNALKALKHHVSTMKKRFEVIYQCPLTDDMKLGYFMPPTVIAIDDLSALKQEVFGPILHVIQYKKKELDKVIMQINQTKYGLTLGIHSRINETIEYIKQRVHVGNCYVNRSMIGAVVGLQPFGGEGLSGTGPKAGGPNYLIRLCHERTFTVDTTAAGGNASLMSLPDDVDKQTELNT
jgi:RHH-type transcriptional regulator, proline utilization regulon repressor / proline dehydrogenase / delta 1-pyrroline-5-carboxylate dehydrogenase